MVLRSTTLQLEEAVEEVPGWDDEINAQNPEDEEWNNDNNWNDGTNGNNGNNW